MGRRTFNQLSTVFAAENIKEQVDTLEDDGELDLATEDWTGGVTGLMASLIPGINFIVNPVTRTMLKAKEKELNKLTSDLKMISVDAGKRAYNAGKLSADDYHKLEQGELGDFFTGALINFIPFYNFYKAYTHSSDLQDTVNKINKVKAEIDGILKRAAADANKADAAAAAAAAAAAK